MGKIAEYVNNLWTPKKGTHEGRNFNSVTKSSNIFNTVAKIKIEKSLEKSKPLFKIKSLVSFNQITTSQLNR